jgi:hydroxymethylpyrimidine pyrophosphatase-like HAD family hydrolase
MANGALETRAAAQLTAPSNDEDGVAVILERLLQGEPLDA